MSKHMVTCVKCGKRFDADVDQGAYYPKQRRYECKSCFNAQKKLQKERFQAQNLAAAEKETAMKQTKTAMILKIIIGVLFLLGSFPLVLQNNFPAFICGLCVAAGLIAWGLVPYFKNRE